MLKASSLGLWKPSRRSRRGSAGLGPIGLAMLWLERAASRRALRDLDARLLRDIGLDREAARQEAHKPFWQA